MPITLNQEILARMGCSAPGCGHTSAEHDSDDLWFHGHCHPEWPTWTRYLPSEGILVISCAWFDPDTKEICDEEITRIAVAP